MLSSAPSPRRLVAPSPRLFRWSSLYPSASNHCVIVIEHRRLTRSDCCLRLIEVYLNPPGVDGSYRRRSLLRAVAYSNARAHRPIRLCDRYPVSAGRYERLAIKVVALSNHELVPRDVDLYHVQRLTGRNTNAAPLADCVSMEARVLAYNAAIRGRDIAPGNGGLAQFVPRIVLDKPRVVTVGHEAYLLALRLFGSLESQASRNSTDLSLGHVPKWKDCSRKLLLSHLK